MRTRGALGADLPIHVVHNGLDAETFTALAKDSPLPDEVTSEASTTVLSVGKFTALKGHDLLIRAVARIVADDGESRGPGGDADELHRSSADER